MPVKIPVEVSARHVHLSQKDLETLFGKGYCLTRKKALSQPDEFSAQETVKVRFQNKEIFQVRVLGPVRVKTQLELSISDFYSLGSSVSKGTPGILLIGKTGKIALDKGAIISQRHLHISPNEAQTLGIKDKKEISVRVAGTRSITFHNIKVRISENYKLAVHLDTDEGNAAGINGKTIGELII